MSDYIASCEQVRQWIGGLGAEYPVYFPQPHGKKSFRFALLDRDSPVQFEHYRPTIVPPVKRLFPARDEMSHFFKNEDGAMGATPLLDTSFRVLAGVRPCDMKGIFLMDLFFEDSVPDPHYLVRRRNTAIIGYACEVPCQSRVFCAAVDSLDHRRGADIFLTPLKEGEILVETMTKRGDELTEGMDFESCSDGPARKIGAVAARPEPFGRPLATPLSALPGLLQGVWESPIWQKHVERCFSCGTCNLVCPTCYCFDVSDELNLDTISGTRMRTWDGCMLPEFAAVAGGHNFRSQPGARQRHRVKRKFEYLTLKYGEGAACVGCGRCGSQCTSHIDIYDIVCDLIETGGVS